MLGLSDDNNIFPADKEERMIERKTIFKRIEKQLKEANEKMLQKVNMKGRRDKTIRCGDLVLIKAPKSSGPVRKFSKVFVGPFRVVDKENVTFTLESFGGKKIQRHLDSLRIFLGPEPYPTI